MRTSWLFVLFKSIERSKWFWYFFVGQRQESRRNVVVCQGLFLNGRVQIVFKMFTWKSFYDSSHRHAFTSNTNSILIIINNYIENVESNAALKSKYFWNFTKDRDATHSRLLWSMSIRRPLILRAYFPSNAQWLRCSSWQLSRPHLKSATQYRSISKINLLWGNAVDGDGRVLPSRFDKKLIALTSIAS